MPPHELVDWPKMAERRVSCRKSGSSHKDGTVDTRVLDNMLDRLQQSPDWRQERLRALAPSKSPVNIINQQPPPNRASVPSLP